MRKRYAFLALLVIAMCLLSEGCMLSNDSKSLVQNDEITINLTALNDDEKDIYEMFCQSYDDTYLNGAEPESVMKMFISSTINEDYETQYQLYTTNPDYLIFSEDEYSNRMDYNFPFDKAVFENAYDLIVEISETDVSHAYITWKSKNGYKDEDGEPFVYGFSLQKDKEIWKVSVNPMN